MDVIDLDSLALEIARKHLLENVSFKELGKLYYAAPSTIHRRLMKWLSEDRFEIHDKFPQNRTAFISARDDALAETLTRRFGIWRARVIRVSGVEPAHTRQSLAKPESEESREPYRASDELHRCLGEAAAEVILPGLRRNMTIGLSSGRGTGFAIESLGDLVRQTPSWASGFESIRLISLCGGVHVGKWEHANADSRDFDADENVFALSTILRTPRNNLTYMTGPISLGMKIKPAEMDLKFNLDLAIIGLGQLNIHHHYFRDASELQLKTMAGPVRQIIEWQSRNPELYDGLAEIVLRLYPSVNKNLPAEFLSIIRETNDSILAAPPEKIWNAAEIMLIAGGKQKIDALYEVLTGGCPEAPINKSNLTLVTDSWTAETLLQRLESRVKSHNSPQ